MLIGWADGLILQYIVVVVWCLGVSGRSIRNYEFLVESKHFIFYKYSPIQLVMVTLVNDWWKLFTCTGTWPELTIAIDVSSVFRKDLFMKSNWHQLHTCSMLSSLLSKCYKRGQHCYCYCAIHQGICKWTIPYSLHPSRAQILILRSWWWKVK